MTSFVSRGDRSEGAGYGYRGGNKWSLWSTDSVLSIGSANSVLSIGSIGSVLSIGSIGSAASLFSIGSAASVGSALSSSSRWSLLSFRATDAVAGSPLGRGSAAKALVAVALSAVIAEELTRTVCRRASRVRPARGS